VSAATRKTSLHIDDYLDLLNLAIQVQDKKWQREIHRKLQTLLCTREEADV